MKKFIYFTVLFFLTACYQVSNKDLFEDFNQRIVIEGKIHNVNSPYYIYVSHSVNYRDELDFNPDSIVQVILSDSKGNSELLTMLQPGIFMVNEISGEPGVNYTLQVIADGVAYIASDSMLNGPKISNHSINYYDELVPEIGYYVKITLSNPTLKTQFYKLEVTLNGKLFDAYSDLIVFDDAYTTDSLEYLVPYAFEIGDSVDITVHNLSQNIYNYYYQLAKQTQNNFSAAQPPLQNPPTNFTNNPLGYFQASAFSSVYLVIGAE